MTVKRFIILIALFYCTPAQGQQKKDTLFFKNGTIVIGKLLKIKLGVVSFDPDDANDITVQLRKLKDIAAVRKIFRIETVDKGLYYGRLLPHPHDDSVYIKAILLNIPTKLEDISLMYPYDNSVAQRFSGSFGLGFSYTKSSDLGRLNFDGNLKYASKRTEVNLAFSGIYTIYDSLFSRDKQDANLKYNYYFLRNWFTTTFLAYQRNLELGLKRRYQEGIGIGNKFLTSKHVYSWARSGIVINQEKSTETDVNSKTLAELFGQFEMNIFKFSQPNINFSLTESFYYSLSQRDRFRNEGSLNAKWEIVRDLYLNLEPYTSLDTKSPASGGKEFDFGIILGINYKFY